MSLLLLGDLLFVGIGLMIEEYQPKCPAINDWDKFNRDTIGMNAAEMRRGMRDGRWS